MNIQLNKQNVGEPWGFRLQGGQDFRQQLMIKKVSDPQTGGGGGGGSALHLNWRRLTKRSVGFISDFLFSLDHNVLYVIQILIKICKFCMLAWFDRLRETTTTIFDLSFFFFFYIFIPHFSMNITSNEKIEKFHLLQGNIRD